jgi:hypothetical protein
MTDAFHPHPADQHNTMQVQNNTGTKGMEQCTWDIVCLLISILAALNGRVMKWNTPVVSW